MIKIYDRENKKIINEEQYGSKLLNILYETVLGRLLIKLFTNPFVSSLLVVYKKTFLSKRQVDNLIKKNNIDMSLYENNNYKSFNDFFVRKRLDSKIFVSKAKDHFISPCDSKLLIYKINDNFVNIKGVKYKISDLIKRDSEFSTYEDGLCLVFRLSMDDYHRYCFPDNGEIVNTYKINGCLHTVSSISKDYEIYRENKRVVSFLKTKNFSDMVFIEVGALLVGKINNHDVCKFKKGDEKGYFSLGGSTIVIFVQKDILKVDEDIIRNSANGIETKVKYGEKIGVRIC